MFLRVVLFLLSILQVFINGINNWLQPLTVEKKYKMEYIIIIIPTDDQTIELADEEGIISEASFYDKLS